MIYLSACLLGVLGGFCAFSENAFFKKIIGQLVVALIFISELALAFYAHYKGYSGICVFIVAMFIGGKIGRVLYFYIHNGGKYSFFSVLPDELRQIQRYFINKSGTEASFDSFSDFMQVSEKEDVLVDEYISYCCNNMVREICEKYGLTSEDLKEFYNKLTRVGAGQSINGHYVALSAITFSETLEFLVYATKTTEISDVLMSVTLLDYFAGKCSAEELKALCVSN